jgi:2',3'-cyclic-nucleotide 2'-phosphodiesterase (5'-nucleotidase family)
MVERPDGEATTVEPSTTRRRFLGAGAAVALGAGVVDSVAAAEADTVTLLHDSHFHGRFGDPNDGASMDIARYQTLIDERRSARANAVFLGNGDDLGPSILGLVHQGEHMIEALNYLDPLAIGVGNHEFDFGIDNATKRFGESDFPWVVANLLTPDGDPIPGTERWIIRDVGGMTLGIFGSGVRNFHNITDYPEDHQALDPVDASQEATAALRDAGADVVVLASHTNHSTHFDIAEAVDGLDAIVGSHSDVTMDEPEIRAGTVISETGDEFTHLGELTLDADGNLVDWQRHDPDPTQLAPDAGMADIVSKWRDALEAELGREFFTTDVALDSRFDTNYARESALGNLICDLMMEYVEEHATGVDQVDAALQNAGGIRSNQVYGPGGITGLQWLDILPFGNTIVTLAVEGRSLKELLDSQIAALPWSSFGAQQSIQVGGIQYEWTGHFGDGEIDNVYVQGEALDPEETYTFTTNSFVAGFDELVDAEVLHESDGLLGTITLDMLEERGSIAPQIENRILRVDTDTGASQAAVRGPHGGPTVTVSKPDEAAALSDDPANYRAVTNGGEAFEASAVRVKDDAVDVTFDELPDDEVESHLRVLGAFDPDEVAYGYTDDDGDLIDLPVAAVWDHFVLKGPVGPAGKADKRP